jgi:hypothetical protein
MCEAKEERSGHDYSKAQAEIRASRQLGHASVFAQ